MDVTKIFCTNIEIQKQKGGGIDFRGKDLFDPLGKCVQRHLREWPRENTQHTQYKENTRHEKGKYTAQAQAREGKQTISKNNHRLARW